MFPAAASQFAEKYQLRQQNPLRQQVENPRLEPNLENSLLAPKSPKMSFSANCKAAYLTPVIPTGARAAARAQRRNLLVLAAAIDRVERTLLSSAFDLDLVRSVGCPKCVSRPWKSGASAPRKP